MTRGRKNLGDWGEGIAAKWLKTKGFTILEQNYFSPYGEIDIVAKLGDDIYFIEVKTRRARELANDLSITKQKLFKFKKTVRHFCYKRGVGEIGIVLAGLIVLVDKITKTVSFRLAVFNE